MKIYIGKNKKEAKAAALIPLLEALFKPLKQQGFQIKTGSFSDQSAAWVEIIKKTKNDTLMNIVISTDEDYNTIQDLGVYETPYKLDTDNEKRVL